MIYILWLDVVFYNYFVFIILRIEYCIILYCAIYFFSIIYDIILQMCNCIFYGCFGHIPFDLVQWYCQYQWTDWYWILSVSMMSNAVTAVLKISTFNMATILYVWCIVICFKMKCNNLGLFIFRRKDVILMISQGQGNFLF